LYLVFNQNICILISDLTKGKKDKAALIKESENHSKEYNRVCKLNKELEKKFANVDSSKTDGWNECHLEENKITLFFSLLDSIKTQACTMS
jgi:hypothetical protein